MRGQSLFIQPPSQSECSCLAEWHSKLMSGDFLRLAMTREMASAHGRRSSVAASPPAASASPPALPLATSAAPVGAPLRALLRGGICPAKRSGGKSDFISDAGWKCVSPVGGRLPYAKVRSQSNRYYFLSFYRPICTCVCPGAVTEGKEPGALTTSPWPSGARVTDAFPSTSAALICCGKACSA